VEAGDMSTVNSQLMRTTRYRTELNQGPVFVFVQNLKNGFSGFSVLVADHLHGAIVNIQNEG
jgi:hypothetical protein